MEQNKLPFIVRQTPLNSDGTKSELSKQKVKLLTILFSLFIIAFINSSFSIVKFTILQFRLYSAIKQNNQMKLSLSTFEKVETKLNRSVKSMFLAENRARLRYGLISIDSAVQQMGVGGRPTTKELANQNLAAADIISAGSLFNKISSLERRLKLSNTTSTEIISFANKKKSELSATPSICPFRSRISSGYGRRMHPIIGQVIFHDGIDMPGKTGAPIIATGDGVVIRSGDHGSYGITVEINHQGTEYITRYAHLVSVNVQSGEIVSRGDIIGFLGNTGRSTGPHLHYEIRKSGHSVNPMKFLLDTQIVMD